jgi:excisionase family DNA binding protein
MRPNVANPAPGSTSPPFRRVGASTRLRLSVGDWHRARRIRTVKKLQLKDDVERHAYRTREVAAKLSVSKRPVDEMIATGELPSFKIGRCRRVSDEALRRFVSDREGLVTRWPSITAQGPLLR